MRNKPDFGQKNILANIGSVLPLADGADSSAHSTAGVSCALEEVTLQEVKISSAPPANPLIVAQAIKYLSDKGVDLQLDIKSLILIKNLEDQETRISSDYTADELQKFSFSQIVKPFLDVMGLHDEDLTSDEVTRAQTLLAQRQELDSSSADEYERREAQRIIKAEELVRSCQVIDRISSFDETIDERSIQFLAEQVHASLREGTVLMQEPPLEFWLNLIETVSRDTTMPGELSRELWHKIIGVLHNNTKFLDELSKIDTSFSQSLKAGLEADKQLAKYKVSIEGWSINHIPRYLITQELVWIAGKKSWMNVMSVSKKFINKKMMIAAAGEDCLRYMPKSLIDEEILWVALEKNPYNIRYAPDHLVTKDMVDFVIKQNCENFCHLPAKFITKEMVMPVLVKRGDYLKHVPKQIIDKEMVYVAVAEHGRSLEYVPEHLIDLELILLAIKQDKNSSYELEGFSNFIPKHLFSKDMILECLSVNKAFLNRVPREFLDRDTVFDIVSQYGLSCFLLKHERADRDWWFARFIDKEIAMIAVHKDAKSFKLLPYVFWTDKDIISFIINSHDPEYCLLKDAFMEFPEYKKLEVFDPEHPGDNVIAIGCCIA